MKAKAISILLMSVTSVSATERYSIDRMADLDRYLELSSSAEIALARSAAPDHISREASVFVLTRSGYEKVREGTNGFVCLVERSWAGNTDYVGAFWDPQIRAPICYNQHAADLVLPLYFLRTELVLDGKGRAEIAAELAGAVASGRFKAPTETAMSYMMSGGQYLHPDIGRWLPHLMIWIPYSSQSDWGPNRLAGPDPVVFRNPGGPFAMVVIPYGEDRFIDPEITASR